MLFWTPICQNLDTFALFDRDKKYIQTIEKMKISTQESEC